MLYDLTNLQRDANKRMGFTAQQTLDYAQSLYEKKLLTYPRTDSRFLTEDMDAGIPELAGKLAEKFGFHGDLPINSKQVINNKKVSDHHAIIPTEEFVQLDKMSNDERKIYDLVVRRFIAVLYPAFEYEQTTMKATVENELFIAKGKIIISSGWKAVYDTTSADSDWDDVDSTDSESFHVSSQALPPG